MDSQYRGEWLEGYDMTNDFRRTISTTVMGGIWRRSIARESLSGYVIAIIGSIVKFSA